MRKKSKNKSKGATTAAIALGIIIVSLAIYFSYSAEQVKISGQSFGNELKNIQEGLKEATEEFDIKLSLLDENHITKEEFSEFGKKHLDNIKSLILRYDELSVPKGFKPAVDLFKLSTEQQLESDTYMIEWIMTADGSAKIRSDHLLQEAIDLELSALSEYNNAKSNVNP